MSLKPGDLVKNRYRITKQLGEGGFGAVYRAEDTSLKTICALKENLDYWDDAQRQFEREALILANLRHPNLPRVTDFFIAPAVGQYLVMDFIEGYDLQTILDRLAQPLDEKDALMWIDQICEALTYLHSQTPPIIHRDVKPSNIKVTPSGKAILVDFGIAKEYDPDAKTITGARAVTPGYSPIEQYGHGKTDIRADQYALGATLYTSLAGQKPPESIDRITGEPMLAPRQLNPSLSSNVELAILRAMAILASNRYPGIPEFREALMAPARDVAPGTSEEPKPGSALTKTISIPLYGTISNQSASQSYKAAVDIEWIKIPESSFRFGEDGSKVKLPAFKIARFPITNQQYKLFLLANPGHRTPAYWNEYDFPAGCGNHPVVEVSLYDAVGFCKWLGCRLPMEEEWEKAARGNDGNSYPWGEEWEDKRYCNNWDAEIGGTTPVDKYPDGVSPYDVWDMVGNVWEWTASEYQGPYLHVLRGGSWRLFSRFNVLVTHRIWTVLNDARDDLGFRPALSI